MENAIEQLSAFAVSYGLKVVGAVAILLVGRLAAGLVRRGIRRALTRANMDATIAGFVGHVGYVGVVVVAVLAALAKFGVETTSLVAVLGAAGFAVGFALQGSLSHFAAGVMIVIFRPFKVGDFIDAAGIAGTVQEIRLFTTVIASPDNVKLIVPNGKLFGDTIKNFSVYDTRRVDLTIGIGYGDSIGRAIEVLGDVMKADERIIHEPAPQIVVKNLGESSVDLLVRCWTRRTDFWNVRCDLLRSTKEHFEVQGIEIPYPQRVVHSAGGE